MAQTVLISKENVMALRFNIHINTYPLLITTIIIIIVDSYKAQIPSNKMLVALF